MKNTQIQNEPLRVIPSFCVGLRMRSMISVLAFAAALVFSLSNAKLLAQQVEPKKYAILIGITKYDHAAMNGKRPLKFPEADAKALGELLSRFGYEVEYLVGQEATREAILKKLSGLTKQANAPGICIVGLFGHGVEMEFVEKDQKRSVQGCFCPFDTAIRHAKDADNNLLYNDDSSPMVEPEPQSLLRMSEVVTAMALAKAESRLLIADCCREIPARPRGRNLGLGANFSTDRLPTQTVMLFGCKPGEQALEHDPWEHGAFTRALLIELERMASEGAVTTGTLSDRVWQNVKALTNNKQNPTLVSLGSLDLLLDNNSLRPSDMKPDNSKSQPSAPPFIEGKVAGEIRPANSLGMKMVWIPAGSFKMGSPNDEAGHQADENQVDVTLSKGFWMGQTEVTQGQYSGLMNEEPWKGKDYVKLGANYAASHVSAKDADDFVAKLNEREQQSGSLPAGWKYVLPTETQWEYSCRAGSQTAYHFGNNESELGQYAWFDKNAWDIGEKYAHEVGQKKPNAWGLYDMHGNVFEWCRDGYMDKLKGGRDPFVSEGSFRVIRGGRWSHSPVDCRSAFRSRSSPGNRFNYLGFRVSLQSVR